ncbi:MAG TPA: putative collagen-binding domain-containing protein [Verrucomicrobiota bacterium]|jgi:hypothetical protein|nr:putative collagen-binding domain-containing protein [Verrucomicrobiota bacterium]HRT08942.1 putative collagen-binding domain-containing protein [Candidatus Paceibacterota bacterium]HRT56287.1 putative collagen-binding domain-containing protein [Candidatus Paceibacterota bacterium]
MTPHGELASSTYCLANPGEEYVVYLPSDGEATVDLSAVQGNMRVEWINPDTGASSIGKTVAGGAQRSFVAPFEGHALIHLRRTAGVSAP